MTDDLHAIEDEIVALSARLKALYAERRKIRETAVPRKRPTAAERQSEVWRRVNLGQSFEQIAEETGQELMTVKKHLRSELWHRTYDSSKDYDFNDTSQSTEMAKLNQTLPPQCRLSWRAICPFRTTENKEMGWTTDKAREWKERHKEFFE